SRWKALSDAVASFVTVLQARNIDAKVAVVTYAENYTFGTFTTAEVSTDVTLTSTFSSVTSAVNGWTSKTLLGDTNIEAGLLAAQAELLSVRARSTADRTVILLTDGVATTGNTNIAQVAGNVRAAAKTVIHTISFGAQASSGTAQTAMAGAAASGNGT